MCKTSIITEKPLHKCMLIFFKNNISVSSVIIQHL